MWGRAKLASQLAYPRSRTEGEKPNMPTKGRTMRFKKASALFIALAVVGVACGADSTDSSGATNAAAGSAAPGDSPSSGAPRPPGGTPPPGGRAGPAAGGSLVIASDL